MSTAEKNKGGRPRKEIDFDVLQKLCELNCTRDEICNFFEIDDKTLTARIVEVGYDSFSAYYKKYLNTGKISLRRIQWQSANAGSVPMQIWLGKQYLGQKDKAESDVTLTEKLPDFVFEVANDEKQKTD
ncbi:hypothetical protein Trichorick_01477 (plasmid) [Candidatus Trichorickettsia mobilis]|uniref:Uncharacterized protein n=1 Tax=Candidatus Trichorickettsia mobilis TaxID=1346319 RepID=A0ABZ0UU60_9RICK|nr:hypothetical protein [Candidatus Trichorickettsia mobilis]WPY01564.1 hypothetical protein Trichorick_01477 [Candidatus Trichorickettsia mobilis]